MKSPAEEIAGQGKIRVLPPEEARRIAAGEVIDRPASLIREFLDNAIDAGGSLIEVFIEEGGIKLAEVIDDGGGMSPEDLALCWQTHATSKIRSLDDLSRAFTLGFRGEALAAAAAVSRLEILTSGGIGEAWRLEVGPGEANPPRIERARRIRGSSVRSRFLFDTIPARKRFLKRESGEARLCRQSFLDKALAFPRLGFRFTQDGILRHDFPATASRRERFAAALLDAREGPFLHEIAASGPGFTVTVAAGGPELYRSDRRLAYIFVNGRRIIDYGLLQALEYGLQGWFPNGVHPVGAVYITIDPKLADFNIHPAKREVRFTDPAAIHHAITSALRDFTRRADLKKREEGGPAEGIFDFGRSAPFRCRDGEPAAGFGGGFRTADPDGPCRSPAGGYSRPAALAMEALLEKAAGKTEGGVLAGEGLTAAAGEAAEEAPPYGKPRYAGRAFGLFIMVEWGERLFIIDQHAAHERILYDRFLAGPVPKQELLVPIPFKAESPVEDRFIEAGREDLARMGIDITRDGEGWRIDALPADWRMGDRETLEAILDLRNAGEHMAERWAATLACHGAVRDGDYLDDDAAMALAEEALALPVPRCPHGRPVWTGISREGLFKAVRRL
ncbi:MAG: DNA mismatch repair endonuclease MutL [Treponema sp.]|jgi:DNA mismatch repair protein MutL|nr:DNA mismatch repair endonuclease MutL [Treponema sp.]